MLQWVTYSTDKISRFTNSQIDYIIEQVNSKMIASHVNEISLTVVTTSAYDFDTNKSDSDIYFKFNDFDSDDEYNYELHERLN
ncbi:unnamed protein product [Rhizophagus irregularis]|nr:unnamed protein product [Rhizophagus irregularis]CAB4405806.1 unnamed protein product [Rhizophagus irregularis]